MSKNKVFTAIARYGHNARERAETNRYNSEQQTKGRYQHEAVDDPKALTTADYLGGMATRGIGYHVEAHQRGLNPRSEEGRAYRIDRRVRSDFLAGLGRTIITGGLGLLRDHYLVRHDNPQAQETPVHPQTPQENAPQQQDPAPVQPADHQAARQ